MAIFERLFGRAHGRVAGAGVAEAKAAKAPIFTRVSPGSAVSTPRRYDRLAAEGYQRNVIAFRAINLVAKALAGIPFVVEKAGVRLSEHPLTALLARPNPRLKGENFLYNFVGYYLIAGNAYAFAAGPDGGPPKELWLMRPDTMSVIEGTDGLPAGFEQAVAGKKQRFGAADVLH